jgi:hypothetical protein
VKKQKNYTAILFSIVTCCDWTKKKCAAVAEAAI